jgi:SAM-dependent methyltransferase
MAIQYDLTDNFPGWGDAPSFIQPLLNKYNCKRILEIGSGANPTISPDFVLSQGLSYVTSDVSIEELEKADPIFERRVVNLSDKDIDPTLNESFDCVFSRMVNEHVRDGQQYHANIYKILKPGGLSIHLFSALGGVPFVANRLLPEFAGDIFLKYFSPVRDRHKHGKFKAYYSWSRGPTKSMIERFQSLGFEVINFTGHFGHHYYIRWPPIYRLEKMKSRYLLKHPIPQLSAYATVVLRKPLKQDSIADTIKPAV